MNILWHNHVEWEHLESFECIIWIDSKWHRVNHVHKRQPRIWWPIKEIIISFPFLCCRMSKAIICIQYGMYRPKIQIIRDTKSSACVITFRHSIWIATIIKYKSTAETQGKYLNADINQSINKHYHKTNGAECGGLDCYFPSGITTFFIFLPIFFFFFVFLMVLCQIHFESFEWKANTFHSHSPQCKSVRRQSNQFSIDQNIFFRSVLTKRLSDGSINRKNTKPNWKRSSASKFECYRW